MSSSSTSNTAASETALQQRAQTLADWRTLGRRVLAAARAATRAQAARLAQASHAKHDTRETAR